MLKTLIRSLADPRLSGVDVDSDALLDVHRRILDEKPMIRGVFREFYDACVGLDQRYLSGSGLQVELGAGTSFFKKVHPEVVATDIKSGAGLDMVVDAMAMPFAAASVRAFYAIHCFHHLPSPDRFFAELKRTLVPGGGCVIIDPYYSPVARVIFKRLFASERYDPDEPGWDAATTIGVMQGANQALSYIVFARDRERFDQRHPELEIVYHRPLTNYPRYLLSGGLNFRQLAPTLSIPVIKGIELAMAPLARWLALHHIMVIRKRG
jgi:SAM-dependent methyltransferase